MSIAKGYRLLEVLALIVVYFFSAKIGQMVAIPPGNVTPIWLPSGITLAWLLIRGSWLWPGIFFGAFFGNITSYISFESSEALVSSLVSGAANGLGDTLCALVSVCLIRRYCNAQDIFCRWQNIILICLLGGVIGGGISAVVGVSGLLLSGLISLQAYPYVFSTWLVGDFLGVVLFTPILLNYKAWFNWRWLRVARRYELLFYTLFLLIFMGLVFGALEVGFKYLFQETLALLIIMWSVYRFPSNITLMSILLVALISTIATAKGMGAFSGGMLNENLIELQLFLLTVSITAYVLISYLVEQERILTRLKSTKENLNYLEKFDALTGLRNKLGFSELLKAATKQERRFSLLFINLDNFKVINDSLGHHTGDKVLIEASKRFLGVLGDHHDMARYGGDEFLVLIEKVQNQRSVIKLARKLINSLTEQNFEIDGQTCFISASIGISSFPDDSSKGENLIMYADRAMHKAKALGKNHYFFHNENLDVEALRNFKIESNLRGALQKGEVYLVFQPKYRVNDGKIFGAEALMRWKNEELGEISPVEFIPIAESCGLIEELGSYVLKSAMRSVKEWQAFSDSEISVSVNVSYKQLIKRGITTYIQKELVEQSISTNLLELEITESGLLQSKRTLSVLDEISKLGVAISIDDFGTGYSSLSYLKKFPIDVVKIDKSFFQDLENNPSDKILIKSIIMMSKGLGLKVLAEGISTKEQFNYFKSEGGDYVQGFYFSKPISSEELCKLLEEEK